MGAAPRHCEFQNQQRAHEIGQPALGENQRKPEEGRAVEVEGIGVHHPAAKVGGPGEGVGGQALTVHRDQSVRVARPLEKAVHIPVEGDLLAVKVPRIVEKTAVHQLERQKDQGGTEGAEPHRQPEFVLIRPAVEMPRGQTSAFHGASFLRPARGRLWIFPRVQTHTRDSIARSAPQKKRLSPAEGSAALDKGRGGGYFGK